MVYLTGIFGAFCQFFVGKKTAKENSKTQSSLTFLQSGPRKFSKSDFFGIGLDPAGAPSFFRECSSKESLAFLGGGGLPLAFY